MAEESLRRQAERTKDNSVPSHLNKILSDDAGEGGALREVVYSGFQGAREDEDVARNRNDTSSPVTRRHPVMVVSNPVPNWWDTQHPIIPVTAFITDYERRAIHGKVATFRIPV